jgi:inner membrane protein
MSDLLQTNVGTRTRSFGLKLILVCGLALFMTLPAVFVSDLVADRRHRAEDVVKDVGSHVGGPQTFVGPTLAVPYSVPSKMPNAQAEKGVYLIFPAQGKAEVQTITSERHRSIFRVPVFQADLKLHSAFDRIGTPTAAPTGAEFDWKRAEIIVSVTDARGALADITLEENGRTDTLTPSDLADQVTFAGNDNPRQKTVLLGKRLEGGAQPSSAFDVTATLRFSGAERIALLPYGKTTHIAMRGNWPSPSFDGAILPLHHIVTDHGFQAEWTVPFTARGIRAEGPSSLMTSLPSLTAGLSFIEVVESYQSVQRSLKYALLFVGLVFLCTFGFEVTTGKRVHPAQYVLVGLAQIIFYLLLLSLAERIGFDFGFLAAATATVTLLASNTGWIFSNAVHGWQAFGLFSVLYVLIYLLLRLEDNALLVGAISSFLAIALLMYLTRKLEWYSATRTEELRPV